MDVTHAHDEGGLAHPSVLTQPGRPCPSQTSSPSAGPRSTSQVHLPRRPEEEAGGLQRGERAAASAPWPSTPPTRRDQRRYVESLSAYARQFLGQMETKVRDVAGQPPTISYRAEGGEQQPPLRDRGYGHEVHDYSPACSTPPSGRVQHRWCVAGRRADGRSAQQIEDDPPPAPRPGSAACSLARWSRSASGEHRGDGRGPGCVASVRARIVTGRSSPSTSRSTPTRSSKHSIEVVVDRPVLRPDLRNRLTDLGGDRRCANRQGVLIVTDERCGRAPVMSELNACHASRPVVRLTPAHFSSNNPLGMCPRLQRAGTRPEMDPTHRPRPERGPSARARSSRGAVGMVRGEGWTADLRRAASRLTFDIDLDVPWSKLPSASGTRHPPRQARGQGVQHPLGLGREVEDGVGGGERQAGRELRYHPQRVDAQVLRRASSPPSPAPPATASG